MKAISIRIARYLLSVLLVLSLTFLIGGLLGHYLRCSDFWGFKYTTGIFSALLYAFFIHYGRSILHGITATLIAFAGTWFCDMSEYMRNGIEIVTCNPNLHGLYHWFHNPEAIEVFIMITFVFPFFIVQGYLKKKGQVPE